MLSEENDPLPSTPTPESVESESIPVDDKDIPLSKELEQVEEEKQEKQEEDEEDEEDDEDEEEDNDYDESCDSSEEKANEALTKIEEAAGKAGKEAKVEKGEEKKAPAEKSALKKRHKEDFDWEDDIIGTGAFGEVKVATDKETGSKYAVKILNKKQIIAQKKIEWVNREKFLLDRMRHPNIVSLYFTFSDPNNLYFVLEFCGHGELLDHIRKHKCFDLECGRFYAAEIICALEYMHSNGVAHRDLKPENILLGEGLHVRICDFGTARELGTEKTARSKSFVGTAEYVCPELLIEKSAGLGADLWSFGCMLYQIFAGRAPFKAPSEYLIFNLIENRQFDFPEHFPELAKDLVNELLVIDQNERIGYRNGYQELKDHAFFDGIDWENLHTQTPPEIKPPVIMPVFKEVEKKAKVVEEDAEAKKGAEREQKLENQKKSIWARFLNDDELIVENSAIIKQKGFSKTKRQLIMTDKPRIFYVDPEKMIIKGEVPISKDVAAEAKNSKLFHIIVPGRVYKLTELNGNAKRWVDSVTKVIGDMK